MLLKQLLVPILLVTGILSCSSPDESSSDATLDSLQEHTTVQDSLDQNKSNLTTLHEYAGQYPSDVQLFENEELNNRIKSLMGDEYVNFRKFWQTETPILMEEEVLFTTGCEQHNCGANQYILQIDLKNDNINVFHIGSDFKSYTEKGPIHLPPGLAKEFLIIKGNTATPNV